MKSALIGLAASVAIVLPAKADSTFRFNAPCYTQYQGVTYKDNCVVVETRDGDGWLKTRNIFSNKFSLTIKSWFDKDFGLLTWDSYNKGNPYKWQYRLNRSGFPSGSEVMPNFYVENLSWD